jgi:cytochrome c oxidase subunit I
MDNSPSHHEPGFLRKYVFSLDHKVIGLQYMFTALSFLLFGFGLVLLMRWQLAYPGKAMPLIGGWFSDTLAPGGVMLPEFYNQLGGRSAQATWHFHG